MSCPCCDLHIHTKYLGCADGTMELPAIVAECERLGVETIGITDHLNSLDKLDLHRPILRDILEIQTDIDVYFGVELNFLGPEGGFAFSEQVKAEMGFQFAIGGIHEIYVEEYDLEKIIEIQHRHHLLTCRDPLVDVLVHPYWFNNGVLESRGLPRIGSMKPVPKSYARELGQIAKETATAIEINAGGNLFNRDEEYLADYLEFLATIADEGAMFTVGSDAHDTGHLERIALAFSVVEKLALDADRIWLPPGRPINKQQNRDDPSVSTKSAKDLARLE